MAIRARLLAALLGAATPLLTGCYGMRYATMTPDRLGEVSDYDLAKAYGSMHDADVRAEIERRGLISGDQWDRVESKTVRIGDPIFVFLAMKPPAGLDLRRYQEVNGPHGTQTVWGFGLQGASVTVTEESRRIAYFTEAGGGGWGMPHLESGGR